ncbi:MAG: hypothetical protein ACM3US_09860 [Sphingomonadaceae bacterium]
MSEATKQLERTVKAGAVLSVVMEGRRSLGPWPLWWIKVDEARGRLEFLWAGPEERIHMHDRVAMVVLDDGQVRVDVPGVGYVLVEPAWEPRQTEILAAFAEWIRSHPEVAHNLPEGGIACAL